MFKVSVLVGNPKPDSRTSQVAKMVVDSTLEGDGYEATTIELANHAAELFVWPSALMDDLTTQVAESDLLVVASPTYKATYTGLLKSFMDRYPARGLQGVVAVPVMTGADMSHSLGADLHLRPLLVELGARVPTASLYFDMHNMDRIDEVVRDWAGENGPTLRRLLPMSFGAENEMGAVTEVSR